MASALTPNLSVQRSRLLVQATRLFETPARSPGSQPATLLVSCSTRADVAAALVRLLCDGGAGSLDVEQHSDRMTGRSLHRFRFDLSTTQVARDDLERQIVGVARRLGLSARLSFADRTKRIALFVSRYDHCLYDLLLRHQAGELSCDVGLVISNHPDLEHVARQFQVPFFFVPVDKNEPEKHEAIQGDLLRTHAVDLVVLARYMQILSPALVSDLPGRIINIHHSFLPAFSGARPYHQAALRGVKLIGATAHYATEALDEGPIIEQDVVRVSHRDTTEDLVRQGRDLERTVLARAVRWHLEDRVIIYENKTAVFGV